MRTLMRACGAVGCGIAEALTCKILVARAKGSQEFMPLCIQFYITPVFGSIMKERKRIRGCFGCGVSLHL